MARSTASFLSSSTHSPLSAPFSVGTPSPGTQRSRVPSLWPNDTWTGQAKSPCRTTEIRLIGQIADHGVSQQPPPPGQHDPSGPQRRLIGKPVKHRRRRGLASGRTQLADLASGRQSGGQHDPLDPAFGGGQQLPCLARAHSGTDPRGVGGWMPDVPPAGATDVAVSARSDAPPVAATPVEQVVPTSRVSIRRPVRYLIPAHSRRSELIVGHQVAVSHLVVI